MPSIIQRRKTPIKRIIAVCIILLVGAFFAVVFTKSPALKFAEHKAAELRLPIGPQGQVRLLGIHGTDNFRDLGGYKVKDGRTVKWNVLYRSDKLSELEEKGKTELAALNLATITDLRSGPEREQEPDDIPITAPPIAYSVLPINDEPVDIEDLGRKIVKGEINEAEIMTLLDHRRFITNAAHRKSWGDWVKGLAHDENLPALFHCTSGKDRTGYGAAIILLTLGASKETVMEDFLLSTVAHGPEIEKTKTKLKRFRIDDDKVRVISKVMGVSRETMEATFAQMEADFGSIDGFIENGLGIDAQTRKALQDKLLEE